MEAEYFNIPPEGVRIVPVAPSITSPEETSNKHLEQVALRYEKIAWKHNDGNIIFSDTWNERSAA
ncbi:hypothetical protein [Pseudenterobacter timonensis]|uniref:hypothetical protein n=1 Tax=Pseudenterobacter timonensis TaxID=1755099 RepID=UPI003F72C1CF